MSPLYAPSEDDTISLRSVNIKERVGLEKLFRATFLTKKWGGWY